MKKSLNAFVLFFVFYGFNLFAQENPVGPFKDTIYFLNGDIVPVTLVDTSSDGVKFIRPFRKGTRELFVESERIFSIKYAGGSETIYYKMDSLIGNEMTVEQIRFFMMGERDAQKFYRSRGATAGGVLVGAASAFFIPSVISFIPPFTYSAILMLPKVKVRKGMVSDPELTKNDAYMLGYERVARKKMIIRSLIGGGAGVAAGFVAYLVNSNNK